ncbi:hypothetical protein [Hallerella porci]|uniref:YD repeat-containing protein n=1 Tax=Hallerella porci TaxID=1945871 RepID=A0ABX5LJC0_9BACT|nr:hypothetical protein [Hallerella porci]PWK94774.1 YD repeat-containing protein [Hallerella porci]
MSLIFAADFYDDHGNKTGRSEERGNTTQYYNDHGNYVGKSRVNSDGSVDYYDAYGNRVGKSR